MFGNDTVSRSFSELPELLNRQSLQYVYVLMNMDCDNALPLVREVSSPNVFICSKEFLLSNSKPPKAENRYTAELSKQVSAVIGRNTDPYIVGGWLTWDEYKAFKKAIFSIRNSDYIAEEKEDFIMQTPLNRLGEPKDVADAVLFLADDDKSSFITGHVLSVNGGYFI